jgi:hypothetical protein
VESRAGVDLGGEITNEGRAFGLPEEPCTKCAMPFEVRIREQKKPSRAILASLPGQKGRRRLRKGAWRWTLRSTWVDRTGQCEVVMKSRDGSSKHQGQLHTKFGWKRGRASKTKNGSEMGSRHNNLHLFRSSALPLFRLIRLSLFMIITPSPQRNTTQHTTTHTCPCPPYPTRYTELDQSASELAQATAPAREETKAKHPPSVPPHPNTTKCTTALGWRPPVARPRVGT